MRFDRLALQRAQRHAYKVLKAGSRGAFSPVPDSNITIPAILRQEQAWLVGTGQRYEFNFGSSQLAAAPTPLLNNVLFADNDVVSVYGIRIYFGLGANAINRQYFTTGIAGDDDSLYNGTIALSLESTQPVENMQTRDFRDEELFSEYAGMQLTNPQRTLSGQLSKIRVEIDLLNSPAGLAFTANTFLSVELHIALGQA